MLYEIQKVEARPDYHLWIRFADGTQGEVDLSHLVGKGVFRCWEDEETFRQVFIDPESKTVAWPGGIDLAPDALYDRISKVPT